MTVMALIPARGGSKGIPKKNIRPFNGKPLIQWSIEIALSISSIDRVLVSTDDPEIASISAHLGAEVPFLRPKSLAKDNTPGLDPVIHALDQLPDVKELLLLQPTSPLRTKKDIETLLQIQKKRNASSIVSLVATKSPSWMYRLRNDNQLMPVSQDPHCYARQLEDTTYVLNGAMFFAKREFIYKEQSLIGDETIGYIMPPERSIDIDTYYDWSVAEFLQKSQYD